jgi:small-conductance mechanosensitive channel
MSIWLPIQLASIALVAVLSAVVAMQIRNRIDTPVQTRSWPPLLRLFAKLFVNNLGTIIFVLVTPVVRIGMQSLTWPSNTYLLGVATSLATAWLVIVLITGLIENPFVNRLVAISAWAVAALSILGLLQPIMDALDSVAVTIGALRISPLLVLKTTVLMLVTLWAAVTASRFLERRVQNASDLTPSVQVLIGKLIRLVFVAFAILIVLSAVGINLSAFAFFSGAVGVGLGFGLQKIVSNLVSGFILLADKSIKPGDVISVDESFGWVTSIGARYTSIEMRDGREFLVPNEDFITQRVINWSHSNEEVRLEVKFGVSYDSDPHKICELAVQTARSVKRILSNPPPVCFLVEFGDFSLHFFLRFWIRDPVEGVTNIRGTVMLALWDAFRREGIEIPFPVRDVRITQNGSPGSAKRKRTRSGD